MSNSEGCPVRAESSRKRKPFEPDPGHAGEGTGPMQNSLFLARLLGPFFLFGGLITFPAGLAIVLTHNVWVANWPVLITIVGWLAMVTGAVRLLAPQEAIKFGRRSYDQPNAAVFAAAMWITI